MKKIFLFLCVFGTHLFGMEQKKTQEKSMEKIHESFFENVSDKQLVLNVNKPAEIHDSALDSIVSFVYYPTGKSAPIGHAELEFEGNFWTLVTDSTYGNRPSREAIKKAQKNGSPFFRFILKTDSQQIQTIKESIDKKRAAITCSRAALYPLRQAGVCSVPLPVNLSPLATAAYLKIGHTLKLNNVQKIEYYGNPSIAKSMGKMLIGSTVETFATLSLVYLTYVQLQICLLVLRFANSDQK